ncbi:hypothetical protein CsatB_020442 [Cannabis sativa]
MASQIKFCCCHRAHCKVSLETMETCRERRFDSLWVPSEVVNGGVKWSKLETDCIKINVNGALFVAEGAYGSGALAQYTVGHIIEGFVTYMIGIPQPILAEIMSIKEALSWVAFKQCYCGDR